MSDDEVFANAEERQVFIDEYFGETSDENDFEGFELDGEHSEDDVFENAAERQAFLDEYFGDSDGENDFDGFDLAGILQNAVLVREVEMNQSANDIIYPQDYDWSRDDQPPINAPFTGNPGLKKQMDTAEPIDFFNLFFDNEMWTTMMEQTNLYAEQNITNNQENMPPNSRLHKWKPVTVDELKNFFALVICMGITRKSDLADFWSTDEVNETPIFGKVMTKDRFFLILRNFHLVNNTKIAQHGEVDYDALAKVRPFINMLDKFCEYYEPEMDLSFDEATCPFKGRVKFRVYNPAKPNKFGIKLYQVCEAESGYCVGFDVYTGLTPCTIYCDALTLNPELSLTTKTVIGLLTKCGLIDKGHHVYLDNYYNSPELSDELDLLNTYICGTLRKNRKEVPQAIQKVKKLKSGEGVFRRRGNTLIIKFHDKRDIHMISSFHEAKLYVTDKTDRDGNPIMKPSCIVDYCKKMGGVDLSDQIVQYYDVLRKTVKWWTKLFFHLFNLLLVNAFVLYKKSVNNGDKRLHLKFRKSVVRELLSQSNAPRPSKRGRRSTNEPLDRLKGRHFPSYIPAREGAKRKRPLRDCIACNVKSRDRVGKKRTQTSYMCKGCGVALCVPTCFAAYHTYQNYKAALRASDSDSESD